MSAPEFKKPKKKSINLRSYLAGWCSSKGVFYEVEECRKGEKYSTEYVRADLCDPTQDERVARLVEASQAWDEYDKDTDFGTQMIVKYNHALRLTRAALRDMGVE